LPLLVTAFVALGLSVSADAEAATVVAVGSTPWLTVNGGATCRAFTENCTAFQACESYRAYAKPSYIFDHIELSSDPTTAVCWLKASATAAATAQSSIRSNVAYVPPPDTPDCTSDSVKNKYVGAWVVGGGSTAPNYACIQGCQYPQGSTAVGLQSSYGMSIGKGNGQTCSGANYDSIDTTTKPSDPPSPVSCGKLGLIYGTVNGVGICEKGGVIPGTSVTKNDSSTTTKTDASGVQAPSQTTNTTTNITNNNGVSTVTQTTTKPDGTKETTTEPTDVFCARKPDDAVCKTKSEASGGDDCKVAPVCKGDAIQCAMLTQQWKTRCDNQQTNAASDLATQVLGGNDPSKNPADKENRDVRPISNSLDQTAFLGGGGLQDKVVTVSGQAITLPFSRLNQYLEWIGRLFVVISLIGAIRIVLGGFKK